jgi:hypothetical protein
MQRAQDDADRAKAAVLKTKSAKRDEDGGWRQQQAALEQQVCILSSYSSTQVRVCSYKCLQRSRGVADPS